MTRCPKCASVSTDPKECSHCGIVFESYARFLQHAHKPVNPEAASEKGSDLDSSQNLYAFDRRLTNLLALPVAFAISALCHWMGFSRLVLWYFFSIPIHELGHAIVAWLGSRPAFPLGALIPMAGFTFVRYDKSILVFLAISGLLLFLLFRSFKARLFYPTLLSLALLTTLIYMSWRISDDTWMMAMTYGGVGGEFALSAFFVVSFYYRLGDRIRWDFFRFPFLIAGSYAFYSAFYLWQSILHGKSDLPSGSFLNGGSDTNGDMDRLQNTFGWTSRQLTENYHHLGKGCLLVIICHYLVFLWIAFGRHPKNIPI